MARPKKDGLGYLPLDTDIFSNKKIRILKARYGNDGLVMYLFLLTEIFKNKGYYLKIDDDYEYILSDEVGCDINKVKQVLNFLSKRSLFDNKLFDSDKVLTSAGIQRRYQFAKKDTARKSREPIEVGRYWLLSREETEPFIKCSLFEDIPGNTDSYSGNNADNSMEKSLNKSKVNNKDIYTFPAELENAFQMYLLVRIHNYGEILPEQVQALRDDLMQLSDNDKERIAIVKKATAGGWKNFYRLKKDKPKEQEKPAGQKKDKFNNFQGRDYDMNDLERQIQEAQMREMEKGQ